MPELNYSTSEAVFSHPWRPFFGLGRPVRKAGPAPCSRPLSEPPFWTPRNPFRVPLVGGFATGRSGTGDDPDFADEIAPHTGGGGRRERRRHQRELGRPGASFGSHQQASGLQTN